MPFGTNSMQIEYLAQHGHGIASLVFCHGHAVPILPRTWGTSSSVELWQKIQ